MILVLMRDIKIHMSRPGDLSVLSAQFGLTPAEILFCERLARGDSLTEAADFLGIALETGRNRIKAIFHKTETHRRQSELLFDAGSTELSTNGVSRDVPSFAGGSVCQNVSDYLTTADPFGSCGR
jgi:DNA-binding CsgD family transcriptional regulator